MEMKQQNTAAADSTQHCEQTTDVQIERKFSPSTEHSLNNSSTSEPDGGEEFAPKGAKSTTSDGNGSDDSKPDLADSYLRRRMKNNESARKSREKRRQIDEELRRQLDMVIAENQKLRSQLELMSMMYRQKSGGNGDVGSSDDVDFPHKLVTSSTTYQSSSTPPLFGADPHVTSAGCGITEADCSWSLTAGKNRPPTVADIIRKRRPAGAPRFVGMRPSVRKTNSNASALVSTTTPPTVPLPVRQNPVANTVLLGGNGLSRTAAVPLVMFAPVELQVGLPKQRLSEPTSTVSFGAGTPYTSSGCQVDNSSALPLDLSQGVDSSSVMDRKYTVDCRKGPFHVQDFTGRDNNSSETVARTVQCQYR